MVFSNFFMQHLMRDIHYIPRSKLTYFGDFVPLTEGYLLYTDRKVSGHVLFSFDNPHRSIKIHSLSYTDSSDLFLITAFLSKIAHHWSFTSLELLPINKNIIEELKEIGYYRASPYWRFSVSLISPSNIHNVDLQLDPYHPHNITLESGDSFYIGDVIRDLDSNDFIVGGILEEDKNRSYLKLHITPIPPSYVPSVFD